MLIQGFHPKQIRYDRKLRSRAKDLRLQGTPAENVLWKKLKGKQLGYKFRRQHSLHGFIVGFYCYELMLVVEIDGEIHQHQKDKDALRDQALAKQGYTTLRFTNDDVIYHLDELLKRIVNRPPSFLNRKEGWGDRC